MPTPRIRILATGGTIAGTASSPTATTGYAAATLSIDALCQAVPGMERIATLNTEQVAAIDSKDATPAFWQTLAKAAQAALDADDVDGIVITHGTDTLEETAYYLQLVLTSGKATANPTTDPTTHPTARPSPKPVVIVGAMRPATSLSADGPLNLLNAVRVAASPTAGERGVLVVMNQQILGARDVAKTNCVRPDAFSAPNSGPLGIVQDARVVWLARPDSPRPDAAQTPATAFSPATPLAQVDLLFAYAGVPAALIDAVVAGGARGIVWAGPGNGSVSAEAHVALQNARHQGVAVIRASRTGSGYVMPGGGCDDALEGFCTAGTLSPYKARIATMLALGAGMAIDDLQGLLDRQ